jgi:hypothetical protein
MDASSARKTAARNCHYLLRRCFRIAARRFRPFPTHFLQESYEACSMSYASSTDGLCVARSKGQRTVPHGVNDSDDNHPAADWITGEEIRARTCWNAQQLRRRIAKGKFPAKIDFDRWNRADVESHLSGKTHEEGWTVNEEAIRLALDGLVRRAKISAAARCRRGHVAYSIPRAQAHPASRFPRHD